MYCLLLNAIEQFHVLTIGREPASNTGWCVGYFQIQVIFSRIDLFSMRAPVQPSRKYETGLVDETDSL